MKYLEVNDVVEIAKSIERRQERFPQEDFTTSVGVVLMNYGDKLVSVYCINGEWEGIKGDLISRDGIPLCPNGHPMLETSRAPRLALVEEREVK